MIARGDLSGSCVRSPGVRARKRDQRLHARQSSMLTPNAQDSETAPVSLGTEVSIRPGKRSDAPRLHELIQEAYRSERSWTTEKHLVRGERIGFDELEAQLTDDEVDPIFVATLPSASGGEEPVVAGCICAEWAKDHPSVGLPPSCSMLGLFAVDPAHQSKRIGTHLFHHAMRHVKQKWGCTEAVLWVIKQRTDILSWYYRMGFRWSGQTKDFVFPELKLHDDIEFKVLIKVL
jgi:GNAT superfamily N-acetyltransferase